MNTGIRYLVIRRSATRFFSGLIGLAALTFVCFRLRLGISSVGFLFLIVVVLLSLGGDVIVSVLLSILAAACLAYYFAPPIFSLRVHDPLNISAILAFLTTSFVISRLVSEVRTKSETALSSVNRKLVEAEERERNRIARDLHDDIGQRLALLAVELDQLQQDLPDSFEPRSRITALQEQIVEISTDVHAISHELHSSKIEYLGIAATMKGFCREFAKDQKAEVDFKSSDLTGVVPPEISFCLYRVLQESLHNAAKYSQVRQFEVELFETADAIHLKVHDAGIGFDPKLAMQGLGLGLTSMEERTKMVNGKLSVASQPGAGTTIHVSVPLSGQRSERHLQQKVS